MKLDKRQSGGLLGHIAYYVIGGTVGAVVCVFLLPFAVAGVLSDWFWAVKLRCERNRLEADNEETQNRGGAGIVDSYL